jgi:DNA-binding transcriptional ArsR family regulator
MISTNQIAEIGLIVGEPSRAAMLTALLGGRALTANELARCANITPQTASSHLARLTSANLVKVAKQGRHRYHRLASPEIARMLENMAHMAINAAHPVRDITVGPRDKAMRRARTCYDHFAGRLGVAITDRLIARGVIEFDDEAGLIFDDGLLFLEGHGIRLTPAAAAKRVSARPLCRPCLDWSERRPHVAGKLGAAICSHFLQRKFVRRIGDSRTLRITQPGHRALREIFGIGDLDC